MYGQKQTNVWVSALPNHKPHYFMKTIIFFDTRQEPQMR